jgi:hypothetical protein
MRDHGRLVYSRRDVLGVLGRSALAASLLSTSPPPTYGQETKVSKEQARYQDTPKNGQQCSGCALFVAPRGCTVVAGDISPNGWCALFVAKTS